MPDDEAQPETQPAAQANPAPTPQLNGHGQTDAVNPQQEPPPVHPPGQQDDAVRVATVAAQAEAASAYAENLRAIPGLPDAVKTAITGATVAEVKASYAQAYDLVMAGRTLAQAEAAAAIPPARGGAPGTPPPTSPLEAIQQGLLVARAK